MKYGRGRLPAADGVDHRRLLPGQVPVGGHHHLDVHRVQAVLAPLVDGPVHGVHGAGVHVHEDLRGPEGPGRHRRAVEHQVGELVDQQPVLAAGRLALGAVGHDDRAPQPGRSQRAPLGGQGEPGPALAPQPAALQLVEERRPRPGREGAPLGQVVPQARPSARRPPRRTAAARRPGGGATRRPATPPTIGSAPGPSVGSPPRRAVPVAVPDSAPEFWSTWRDSVRSIGVGEERRADTVPPLSEVTTPWEGRGSPSPRTWPRRPLGRTRRPA